VLSEAFAREYLAEIVSESRGERRAVGLWAWYHVTCEAYDRTVCTGGYSPHGEAMPIDGRERALINQNAIRMRREVIEAGDYEGVTPDGMDAGRRRVQWMRLADLRDLAVAPKYAPVEAKINWSPRPVRASKNTPL
jgi:hypothetical protein